MGKSEHTRGVMMASVGSWQAISGLPSRLAQFWRHGRLLAAATWKRRVATEFTVIRLIGVGPRRRLAELRASTPVRTAPTGRRSSAVTPC